jgi:hypothetical protein
MAFRSAASTTATSVGTVTATAPAGYAANDVLVAVCSSDGGPSDTIGFPLLWTKVRTDGITHGDTQTMAWGWIVATGSDSFVFTSTANSDVSISIGAYSGRSGTPINVTPSANVSDPVTPPSSPITSTATSITPVSNGCDIVMLVGSDSNLGTQSSWSAGGSLNLRTNSGTNFSPTALSDFNQGTAGATGGLTMTRTLAGDAGNYVAYLVALTASSGDNFYGQICL